MLVPFDEMPDTARIWIYQSNRVFNTDDLSTIDQMSTEFLSSWAAHGNPLKSSFKIFHDQFLVISVDEQYNQASGCSIDASVALIKTLSAKLNIDFFDRTRVCFMADGKIFDSSMSSLKGLISEGRLTHETLTFNNLVQTKGELDEKWLVPAEESWLKRYF